MYISETHGSYLETSIDEFFNRSSSSEINPSGFIDENINNNAGLLIQGAESDLLKDIDVYCIKEEKPNQSGFDEKWSILTNSTLSPQDPNDISCSLFESQNSSNEVPYEIGELSHARETPPPKMTFRKRRSKSSTPTKNTKTNKPEQCCAGDIVVSPVKNKKSPEVIETIAMEKYVRDDIEEFSPTVVCNSAMECIPEEMSCSDGTGSDVLPSLQEPSDIKRKVSFCAKYDLIGKEENSPFSDSCSTKMNSMIETSQTPENTLKPLNLDRVNDSIKISKQRLSLVCTGADKFNLPEIVIENCPEKRDVGIQVYIESETEETDRGANSQSVFSDKVISHKSNGSQIFRKLAQKVRRSLSLPRSRTAVVSPMEETNDLVLEVSLTQNAPPNASPSSSYELAVRNCPLDLDYEQENGITEESLLIKPLDTDKAGQVIAVWDIKPKESVDSVIKEINKENELPVKSCHEKTFSQVNLENSCSNETCQPGFNEPSTSKPEETYFSHLRRKGLMPSNIETLLTRYDAQAITEKDSSSENCLLDSEIGEKKEIKENKTSHEKDHQIPGSCKLEGKPAKTKVARRLSLKNMRNIVRSRSKVTKSVTQIPKKGHEKKKLKGLFSRNISGSNINKSNASQEVGSYPKPLKSSVFRWFTAFGPQKDMSKNKQNEHDKVNNEQSCFADNSSENLPQDPRCKDGSSGDVTFASVQEIPLPDNSSTPLHKYLFNLNENAVAIRKGEDYNESSTSLLKDDNVSNEGAEVKGNPKVEEKDFLVVIIPSATETVQTGEHCENEKSSSSQIADEEIEGKYQSESNQAATQKDGENWDFYQPYISSYVGLDKTSNDGSLALEAASSICDLVSDLEESNFSGHIPCSQDDMYHVYDDHYNADYVKFLEKEDSDHSEDEIKFCEDALIRIYDNDFILHQLKCESSENSCQYDSDAEVCIEDGGLSIPSDVVVDNQIQHVIHENLSAGIVGSEDHNTSSTASDKSVQDGLVIELDQGCKNSSGKKELDISPIIHSRRVNRKEAWQASKVPSFIVFRSPEDSFSEDFNTQMCDEVYYVSPEGNKLYQTSNEDDDAADLMIDDIIDESADALEEKEEGSEMTIKKREDKGNLKGVCSLPESPDIDFQKLLLNASTNSADYYTITSGSLTPSAESVEHC